MSFTTCESCSQQPRSAASMLHHHGPGTCVSTTIRDDEPLDHSSGQERWYKRTIFRFEHIGLSAHKQPTCTVEKISNQGPSGPAK